MQEKPSYFDLILAIIFEKIIRNGHEATTIYLPPIYFSQIHGYSIPHTHDAVYVIGGNYLPFVVEYRNDKWRRLGILHSGRMYSGAITVGDKTMIIGGSPYHYRETRLFFSF